MIHINLDPDRKTMRQFGFIALVGFGALGGLVMWRNGLLGFDFGGGARPVAYVLWGLGAFSGLLSLVAPRGNRALFVGLSVATYPIGLVVSYVILGLVFYGLFAPLGILFRLIGRDALCRKIDRNAPSYWVEPTGAADLKSYFRQF